MTDVAIDVPLKHIVDRVDRVRRRLAVTSVLRWIAVLMAAVLGFVLGYAWLDHHYHFGALGRTLSLALLGGGSLLGLIFFIRSMRRDIALEHAARYIESRVAYRQQLLAAIEYHTHRESYPYSEDLAHYLVRTVAHHTEKTDWIRLIPRWPRTLSMAVIVLGSFAVLWMGISNGSYFSHYLARLVQPTAAIAPLPPTTLVLTTGDIVIPEKSTFEVAAAIEGALPKVGSVVFTAHPAAEATAPPKRMEIPPVDVEAGAPRFAMVTQLPLGEYTYRFAVDDFHTEDRKINVLPLPQFTELRAHVAPPEFLEQAAYDEVIEEGTLNVIEGSIVTLTLTPSVTPKGGHFHRDGESPIALARGEGDTLQHTFTAKKASTFTFDLTSTDDLTNTELMPLAVAITKDEDPTFNYTSPGSDYLATNVASIPLEMTVTDDFGLTAADLVIEINDGPALRFPATLSKGDKETILSHTLELERYDLAVGDTILVYGAAEEVASKLKDSANAIESDINFIEIRAYNQIVYQAEASMPNEILSPQGMKGESIPPILTLLEYTRAVMKKTWSLKNASPLDDEDKRVADNIASDTVFIAGKIQLLRKRDRDKLSESQYNDLTTVTDSLLTVSNKMRDKTVAGALEPSKTAYRLMRKLADELEKGEVPPGGGRTPDEIDKIKLEEQVHLTRFEDEQVQWALKELAQDLDSLKKKQKKLGERFDHFLQAQAEQTGHKQDINDEETTTQESLYPASDKEPSPPSEEESSGGGGGQGARISKDGSLLPPNSSPSSGQGMQQATSAELLEMLQAAQDNLEAQTKALEEQLRALAKQGGKGSSGGSSTGNLAGATEPNPGKNGSNNNEKNSAAALRAAEALARAREAMAILNQVAAAGHFQTEDPEEARDKARESMDTIEKALDTTSDNIEGIINRDNQERTKAMLAARAQAIAEIAEALEKAPDAAAERKLQSELKDLVATGETGGATYITSFRGAGAAPSFIALVDSIVPPADTSSIPAFIDAQPRRAARYLAEQFLTLAIESEKVQGDLRAVEAADARYAHSERAFYESAAKFEGEGIR